MTLTQLYAELIQNFYRSNYMATDAEILVAQLKANQDAHISVLQDILLDNRRETARRSMFIFMLCSIIVVLVTLMYFMADRNAQRYVDFLSQYEYASIEIEQDLSSNDGIIRDSANPQISYPQFQSRNK